MINEQNEHVYSIRPQVYVSAQGFPDRSSVVHAHLFGMTTTPTHSGLERLLTVHELSDYLGIPVATLYDWRVDGVGPQAVKLGRSLRYPESCVRAWIEEKLRG
jgi:excisionase family DNA binding protein